MDKGDAISKGLIEYWDKKGRKKEDTPAPRKAIGVNASIQAIKDKYGDEAEEAVDVFLEYTRNRYSISSLVAERNALKIKKGMSKAERQAIKVKRAELNAKLKEVRAKQKELRKEAKRIKNLNRAKKKLAKQEKTFAKNREAMKRTEERIKDLQKRLSKGKGNPAKIRELLQKAENRLQNQANRNDGLVESISETKNVISNKGVVESTNSLPFGLSECCIGHKHTLAFKPYRELNEREKLVNWTKLNDSFTSIEEELRTELETIITEEVERISEKVEKELSAGEIAFILGLLFMIFGKLKAKIKEVMTRAYHEGVISAVSETKADTPKTPTAIKQQINIESEIIATTIEENLNNEAKSIIQNAVLAGAGAIAISTAMRDSLKKRSIQYSSNVAGLAGKYVNVGRSTVFNKPDLKIKIVGYQRSEALDSRTCATCRALDGRIVKADDPFASLTQVHNNCRGLWLALYDIQEISQAGIPKSIQDRFNLVGGYPIPNDFKQIKNDKKDSR